MKKLKKYTALEVTELVEHWHTNRTKHKSLHQFLGWTRAQYAAYVEKGLIPDGRKCPVTPPSRAAVNNLVERLKSMAARISFSITSLEKDRPDLSGVDSCLSLMASDIHAAGFVLGAATLMADAGKKTA